MAIEAASPEDQLPPDQEPAISLGRVLKVVTPIVVVLVGLALFLMSQLPSSATEQLHANLLDALLADREGKIDGIAFVDTDSDMVADAPADNVAVKPEKLVFSYVAEVEGEAEAEIWQQLVEAVAAKTGIPTEYVPYASVREQLIAMRDGKLHVTAFNSGAVPRAVTLAGFVPVSTFGKENGTFGYTMKMIVANTSTLQKLEQLRSTDGKKRKVEFVRPDSNSGFKAPIVLLLSEYKMIPERDYDYSFSMGHETSVADVVAGRAAVAPVASDLLDQMIADGTVQADEIRSIYESERFPPAAIGYAHNLTSEIRTALSDVLVNFDWKGTKLAEKYGPSGSVKFAPVVYKDDWANIRRIDDAIAAARESN